MKVAIVGSRNFTDYEFLKNSLATLNLSITEVISGGAKGADSLARRYANEIGVPLVEFMPNYKKFGRLTPIQRNSTIVVSAEYLVAFVTGESRGTWNTIAKARAAKLPVHVFYNEAKNKDTKRSYLKNKIKKR